VQAKSGDRRFDQRKPSAAFTSTSLRHQVASTQGVTFQRCHICILLNPPLPVPYQGRHDCTLAQSKRSRDLRTLSAYQQHNTIVAMLAAQRAQMGLRQRSSLTAAQRSVVARPLCRRVAMRQGLTTCTAASPQWPLRLANAIQQQPAVLLACQTVVACQKVVSVLRDGFSRAFPQMQNVSKEVSAAMLHWEGGGVVWVRTGRCCGAVWATAAALRFFVRLQLQALH